MRLKIKNKGIVMKFKILLMLIGFFNFLQAVESERRLSMKEVEKSWKLYAYIKYFPADGNREQLLKNVAFLLKQGALPTIIFEQNSTALSLAQQKKLEGVVAVMQPHDPLHRVWTELNKRGIVKKSNL